MSVFNIDSLFSSSVRYPERYVLKPEIIICRLKKTTSKGATDNVFFLLAKRLFYRSSVIHSCENLLIEEEHVWQAMARFFVSLLNRNNDRHVE